MGKEALLFTVKRPDAVMVKGDGMYLWDTTGKQYLDFIGGWAVNALGHSPKVLSEAISDQAKTLLNASPAYYNQPMIDFATALTQYSCFDKVFFGSSGAEANEGAIKLARKYGAKFKQNAFEIITFEKSFHGRTLATMSATGKAQWKSLYEPKVPGFIHCPFNDLEAVKRAITPNTVAIMLEPVQGEGGVFSADPSFVQGLKNLCKEHQLLLIFDEVQTGFGRTGTLFCYEHYNVKPDIMTLGKGIGGGFPLSAMLCTKELDIFEPGDQGGTYMGQPLAMRVGLTVLNTILNEGVLDNVNRQHDLIVRLLTELQSVAPITNIRGKGLLIGFDIDGAQDIAAACFEKGLIINACSPTTIRIIPPLIVSDDDIHALFGILKPIITARTGL